MCGIGGVLHLSPAAGPVEVRVLHRMRDALKHRGPDGDAIWVSPDGRTGLVHTRLAILDLSTAAAQPMVHASDDYVIVFNGEIYNFVELRRGLEEQGHRFRTTSDTEVLLELYVRQGPKCVDALDGMFAFAIWDTRRQRVFLARDHLGEKPLYWARTPSAFVFGSEVRAVVASGLVSNSPDLEALALFLRQGSIPPPWTHLADVHFLQASSSLTVDLVTGAVDEERYWRVPFVDERAALDDPDEALARVEAALRESAVRRLRSDVPMGAFLSGGIDSAAVCALLVEAGARDLQTFTVSLPGQPGDEAAHAAQVAQHLGVRHTTIPLDLGDSTAWLDEAVAAMDVPSIDGPNTWLVSRAVSRAHLSVACSGLGGDELFLGYPSFTRVPRAHSLARPLAIARPVRGALRRAAARVWSPPRLGRVLDAAAAGASIAAVWFAVRGLFSEYEVRDLLDGLAARYESPFDRVERLLPDAELAPVRAVSALELQVYMHDQLLRDTDAMSMAHALEVRVPLIARPVVETVASISGRVLAMHGRKWILRRLLENRLPRGLWSRPKQGFTLNWPAILAEYPVTAANEQLLRPGRFEREYARLRAGEPRFARYFALLVARRAFGRVSPAALRSFPELSSQAALEPSTAPQKA